MADELLPYYERELTALRHLGRDFAQRYPKIASRLTLEGDRCDDPHVERLIESFAYVAARIHKKIDDEFPEITDALFAVLYPHYQRPIPSMSIAQFLPNPQTEQLATAHRIDRHSTLLSQPINGTVCKFRTAYPVDVWPLRVAEARLDTLERSPFATRGENAAAVLRIKLRVTNGALSVGQLGVDRLRFFLDGEPPLMHALYELLFNSVTRVVVATGFDAADRHAGLPATSIVAVGFEPDDGLLDYDARSFLGYRLLTEYFAFPEKFLFFDVTGLAAAKSIADQGHIEIAILLREFQRSERLSRLSQTLSAANFRLGCTPIVNLFKQSADPIRITHRKTEYAVSADSRRPLATEIYSVDAVRKVERTAAGERVVPFRPFYSIEHGVDESSEGPFWYAQRRPSTIPDDPGTEVQIALVDLAFTPQVPTTESLSLAVTATNRDLPERLPFGGPEGDLEIEGGGVVARARMLRKPSATLRPALRRGAQWRLISQLSLNHLSLVDGGRDALLEILTLYNFSDSQVVKKQIAGITRVSSGAAIARITGPQSVGFVRGTEIRLEFDEDQYIGSGVYLLAAVLERFLGLYCAVNSFTQLTITTKQREGALAKWAPRAGMTILV